MQAAQPHHRRRIALVRRLLRANLQHQLRAAEPLDDFVDRRDGEVVALLALVRLETRAVAAERRTRA